MIFINVTGPVGRQIFARGDHTASFGAAPITIPAQAGTHTFETVLNDTVDFRGRVVNVPDGTNVDLELQPVVPPEIIV